MSLEVTTGSVYHDMIKPDQRIPNIIFEEQIPNINFTEKSEPEKVVINNFLNGTDQGNDKKANSEKQVKSAISKANNQLKFTSTRCEFTYYDDINRVAIKVIDKDTNEIIREIPPEETLELVQKLWEFAGLLYDKKG